MSLEPQWNERISKTGRPEQPLRANRVLIQMEQTISRGITTDVRARGRYFSGFCWAMYRVMHSPITADLPRAEKRSLLEGIEEILGLASYRRQQTHNKQKAGLSGVTGSSNISENSIYEGDSIDLSAFTLLDNSPYAIRRFQSTMGNFYLKQGEFALTAAGQELAESLDEIAGPYFEEIVSAVKEQSVTIELLDNLADVFTHQGCFTSTENNHEQDTLQRILMGLVTWNERDQTVDLMDWPSRIDLQIDDYYDYIVAGEQFEDNLRDSVSSNVHHLRRAWSLAILRAHDIIVSKNQEEELSYDDQDKLRFRPIRPLGRIYYLQGQLAHALRAQLWGLATHLRHEAPEGVPRKQLLSQIEAAPIATEATAVLQSETSLNGDRMSQSAITRELFRAGRVKPIKYKITVPEKHDAECESLTDLRAELQARDIGTWRPVTDPELNGRTLIEATNNCLPDIESATTRTEAIDALGRLCARSTIQLVAAIEQYEQLVEQKPLLERYVKQEFGQRHSSLVKTSQYLNTVSEDIPLSVLARRIFEERVITIHNYVIQDRLGSGSISMVFGTGADAGDHSTTNDQLLFAAGGTASPSTGNLRYKDLRRLMRDAGLLTYHEDTNLWVPTPAGETVIARFRGEYE